MLSRAIGGVDKDQLAALVSRYQAKYDKDLVHVIQSETGSNYEKALTRWITCPDPSHGLLYVLTQDPQNDAVRDQCVKNLKVSICMCICTGTGNIWYTIQRNY